ncbi:MAG: hypothetical protein WC423_24005, partial [Vulcanimicrobiota bacterium]
MKNVSQLPFHHPPGRVAGPSSSPNKGKPVALPFTPDSPQRLEPRESVTFQQSAPPSEAIVRETPQERVEKPRLEESAPQSLSLSPTQELLSNDSAAGTLTLLESPAPSASQSTTGPSLVELLGIQDTPVSERRMESQEKAYLRSYPYEGGPKAETVRAELKERYTDPRNSTEAFTRELQSFAEQRGVVLEAPDQFQKPLSEVGVEPLKKALAPTVEALFGNKEANHNPEKKALVSAQAGRFLDLVAEAAPPGMSASDAFKLAQDNAVLVAYQDRVSSEVFMGDHGVRHLLGHNIRVCEELADKVVAQGGTVSAKDRLVMHQTMVMHDLGY